MRHLSTISQLKGGTILLNSKLENMIKSVIMLNNSSNVLDKILQIGKMMVIEKVSTILIKERPKRKGKK